VGNAIEAVSYYLLMT